MNLLQIPPLFIAIFGMKNTKIVDVFFRRKQCANGKRPINQSASFENKNFTWFRWCGSHSRHSIGSCSIFEQCKPIEIRIEFHEVKNKSLTRLFPHHPVMENFFPNEPTLYKIKAYLLAEFRLNAVSDDISASSRGEIFSYNQN